MVFTVVFNFNLGVYGDVIRVKILYNKRDSALIQFKEAQQTQTGGLVVLIIASIHGSLICIS